MGTGDWVAGQRPMNWRQNILYLYPNGMTPLTAIMSMMSSKSVDDPQFHWWTETMGSVGGGIIGIFTDPACTIPYAGGGVLGDTIYVSITALLANRIRIGHQILLRDASDYLVDVTGKVTGNTIAAFGTLAVRLLEADDNALPTHDLQDADRFLIIGNINPEGGQMPDAVAMNPEYQYNYTQIFRTPLSITRTARLTRLRTGSDYQKAKREALEMHGIEQELAYLWGIRTQTIGDNGKPERTTLGLINFLRSQAAANCDDYRLNATYVGVPWTTGGETWLKTMFEQIFRYGAEDKLVLCGSGALLGIDALAMAGGQVNLQPAQKTYGMQIRTWITPFGTVHFKTHPLFSYDTTTRNMMVVFEPKTLTYKYITDTKFFGESTSAQHPEGYGSRRIDGTEEEFLTEAGIEMDHPIKGGVLNSVGLDG